MLTLLNVFFVSTYSQCATDCGPQNVLQIWLCMQMRAGTPLCHVVFTWLKPYFNVRALIFFMCEGSSQPIANQLNMQKIMESIFLTMKATIFDTHSINSISNKTYVCLCLGFLFDLRVSVCRLPKFAGIHLQKYWTHLIKKHMVWNSCSPVNAASFLSLSLSLLVISPWKSGA